MVRDAGTWLAGFIEKEFNKLLLSALAAAGFWFMTVFPNAQGDWTKTEVGAILGALLIIINPRGPDPQSQKTVVTTPTPSTTITSETKES